MINPEIKSYCHRCGNVMSSTFSNGRTRPTCSACGFIHYQNPVPGAGVLVEMDGGVVLIRRGHSPKKGKWALPAGFIEADESIEEAAIRECKEETNLHVELTEMFGVDSFPEGSTQSGIIIFYRAHPIGGNLTPGDDAVEARIFAPDALPRDLAFRTHRDVLTRWAGLYGIAPKFIQPTSDIPQPAPDVFIRRAVQRDEEAIFSLLVLIPANQELDQDAWRAARQRFRENIGLNVLVAERDDQIIGFIVLSMVPAITGIRAWVDDLAVAPQVRRRGIGQLLVEAAIRWASRHGATHLYLDTGRGNSDAQDFYQSCGFTKDGIAPLHIR